MAQEKRFLAPRPIHVFYRMMVLGAAPGEPERLEALRRVPSPLFSHPQHFVERAAELAQLTQGWTRAHQGTRQVVIIAGEAGIGKTALVDTFVAQVAADEPFWVGHGQCIEPYGVGEPYLPVLEALGRLGRGPEGTRLVAVLRQYAPSWLVQMPALLPPVEWEAFQRTVGSVAPGAHAARADRSLGRPDDRTSAPARVGRSALE